MDATVLAIVAVNEFTWFALLALLFSGGPARAFYRRAKVWLDRVMGGVLALLGLRLDLSPADELERAGNVDASDLGEVGRRLVEHEQRLGAAVDAQRVAGFALGHFVEHRAGRDGSSSRG